MLRKIFIKTFVAICFPLAFLFNRTPAAIYFHFSDRPSNTTKTVGGEAVRRFFLLKYAVLLYTLSTLFTDPSLRKQKPFRKVFCQARKNFVLATERSGVHFSKKASTRPPHPPHPLVLSSLGSGEEVGGKGIAELIKDLGGTTANGYAVDMTNGAAEST